MAIALKILIQILLVFLSTVFIGTSVVMVHERWSASEGPSVVAVLQSKTVETRRRGSKAYYFLVAFKPNAADSVWAHTEVDQQTFLANNSGDLVRIHYQDTDRLNVIIDSESWFPWMSIVMLAFGASFFYGAISLKLGRKEKLRKRKLRSKKQKPRSK